MSATSRLLREQRKTNRLLRELLSELQAQTAVTTGPTSTKKAARSTKEKERAPLPRFYPVPVQPFPMEPYRFDHPERFRIGDFPPFYGTTTCGRYQ